MDIREKYELHYGVVAGYLPHNIDNLAHWHKQIAAELAEVDKGGPLEYKFQDNNCCYRNINIRHQLYAG